MWFGWNWNECVTDLGSFSHRVRKQCDHIFKGLAVGPVLKSIPML